MPAGFFCPGGFTAVSILSPLLSWPRLLSLRPFAVPAVPVAKAVTAVSAAFGFPCSACRTGCQCSFRRFCRCCRILDLRLTLPPLRQSLPFAFHRPFPPLPALLPGPFGFRASPARARPLGKASPCREGYRGSRSPQSTPPLRILRRASAGPMKRETCVIAFLRP